ncbi:MAG: acyl carrier protein [Deltaproteobacteria bacterium]|nr:acyl carrier protein [Deltaproteobacteria bacterium]
MTPEVLEAYIREFLAREFEIIDPGRDENLPERYDFDSIDALELITALEDHFRVTLTVAQKKQLFQYRSIAGICGQLAEILNRGV